MPKAKVEVSTSWTRTSDKDSGTRGIGVAFIEPKAGGQHLPAPAEASTHTAALLSGLEKVFGAAPAHADLEVELPHRLLVSTFARNDSSPAGLLETAKFLKAEALHKILASPALVQAFLLALSKRSGTTRFSVLLDRGRYMSEDTTRLQPPGIIAPKRMEAVARGAFMIFRAVAGNDDLLEVRWAAIIDKDLCVFQDRCRDVTVAELCGFKAWAGKLDSTPSEFDPEFLADVDPGMFWSCVRHGGPFMQDWSESLRSGRAKAFSERDEMMKDAGLDCDPEFSGEKNYDVALVADRLVYKSLQEMPGYCEDAMVMEMFEKGDPQKIVAAEEKVALVTALQQKEAALGA